jgi:hypothetical protein
MPLTACFVLCGFSTHTNLKNLSPCVKARVNRSRRINYLISRKKSKIY